MENGVGVVNVKGVDVDEIMVDAISHFRKESEDFDVFEEAIDNTLADGFGNIGAFNGGGGNSRLVNEGSDGEAKDEGSVSVGGLNGHDGVATEESSVVGVDGGVVGTSSDVGLEKSLSEGAEVESLVVEESGTGVSDEGGVVEQLSSEGVEVERLIVEEGESGVVDEEVVLEKSLSEGVEVERLILEEGGSGVVEEVVLEKSLSEGVEVERLIVEEGESGVADEDVVEKLIVVENSQDRDSVKDIAEDDAAACRGKDANEVAEDPVEKVDKSYQSVVDGHLSSEDKDASNSKNHSSNGVSAENAEGGNIDSEAQVASMVSKDQDHHNEGLKVKQSHPAVTAPVDSPPAITSKTVSTPAAPSVDKVSSPEKVAPEKTKAPDTLLSSNATAGKNYPLTSKPVIEERKTEEKQGSGASGITAMKAAGQNSASSSAANSSDPPVRPAGLGRAAPLLEPAPRAAHQSRVNAQVSQTQSSLVEDTTNGEVEEGDEIREKLQMIRVKFLRLAHRLGQTPHNVVVAQVLYRLGLAEQLRARNGGRVGAFSFDRASAMAEQLEASGREALDFSCTIMVLGKTGVGKSATVNSIFDEVKFNTDAFQMGTKKVQDVVGTVQGIKLRVIDTPGLLPSCVDQRQNERILHSVKRFIKKSPPDIVLYLDRLDMPSRDFSDMPLLRTITEIFGPSIWFNAIVVLTHAASAPPEGPNGTVSTYDMFVTQRSHAVQQAIRQAAGDMRLMNPVSLVENHSACRTNRAGQRVLPNGQVWKPHLLLLSFASKILAEANTLLKLQDTPPGKPFATHSRAPSLPLLLSSLLQSRLQLKLPNEQFADDDAIDDDLDESSDSDEESEYDDLPPFKSLSKDQLAKLSRVQKKAYYDELEYREKLFMKKQLKEERRRRRMMKKMEAAANDIPGDYGENVGSESDGGASLPVPMPDLPLPASFDSDNPTHRYRCLDTSNQWLVRPNLDTHGWDHDVGYEGLNIERMFVVKDKVPVSLSGQISKDKKEANLQMELATSLKHGEGKATTMGFDMQSVGKELAYTLRSETRFSNYKHNKATAGFSATVLGDALSAGLKFEDKLIVNKQFRMVMCGGGMVSREDVAYGGSLEATFRDKDYPVGRFLSTLLLTVMDWHGELALGGNFQTQIPVGRLTTLVARANLNNRGSGQVSLRLNSSEQLQLALIGLIPLVRKVIGYQEQ